MNRRTSFLITLALLVPCLIVVGQNKKTRPKVKRARAPEFQKTEVDSVFFSDVFQKLVGTRPANLNEAPKVARGGGGNNPAANTGGGGGDWSKFISSSTIEDEVKALKLLIDKSVSKPGEFKGRGYLQARVHFSILAVMFAMIDEYDGDVRWKKNAKVARDLFARAAANCKSGSQQVYDQAKLRKADLGDLLQGGNVSGKPQDRENWENFVDRAPLMKRLEKAQQGRLQPSLSAAAEFAKNADMIKHEAEMIAALARALQKEGMDDTGDETYDGYAKVMEKGAADIVTAVKLKNHEAAQKALGEISKACSSCHDDYKG